MKAKLILGITLAIGLASLSSCEKKIQGCTDEAADNFNGNANEDDGSCLYSKHVGESFEGGIIVYVDNSGQHGIIAANEDQSADATWGSGDTTTRTNARQTIIYSGDDNTAILLSVFGDGDYAAKICDDLVLNGYDDWFLPSKSELKEIYDSRGFLDGLENDFYWSSTENDNDLHWDLAWYQNMTDGYQATNYRYYQARVRAVRIF